MDPANRFITFDRVRLSKSKIVADNDDELVVSAVIASEIVHKYADGMAYKPAEELEKAAWTLNGRWVKILDHPVEGTIQRVNDISGYVMNARPVRDLKDPKTGRPSRKGVVGDIHFLKHARGRDGATPVPPEMLEKIRAGELNDTSIGFTFEKDETPGEWGGMRYDYIQRNIFYDHVAAPVAEGRCPTPLCGIGADSMALPGPRLIGRDPWEEGESYIRSGHRDPGDFDKNSLRTIEITEGVKAVVACPRGKYEGGKCTVGMEVQSYLFDKEKFTMEQARAWFKEHKTDSSSADTTDSMTTGTYSDMTIPEKPHVDSVEKIAVACPICDVIKKLGELEFSKRLARTFGLDAVLKAVDAEAEKQGPRAEEERAKAHFNISDEEWEKLSEEEKQVYIDKLPLRGSAKTAEEDAVSVTINKSRDVVERTQQLLHRAPLHLPET